MNLHCIACDQELQPVDLHHAPYQPSGGVIARTTGNFGSTAFDSIDGTEELIFFVCDCCLRNKRHRIYAQTHRTSDLVIAGTQIA